MKRELKFRAWAHASEVMFYPDHGVLAELPNTSLMQFTGLKDKNGVEIYEGDIFRSETIATNRFPVKIYTHLVEWNGLAFTFKSLSKGLDGIVSNTMLQSPHLTEIIGNIHANPELL